VSNNSVPVSELASLIRSVHEAVARLGTAAPVFAVVMCTHVVL
jgi:predicted transcriptional regulator